MKLGEYLPACAGVVSLEVTRLLDQIIMFLGALVDSEKPGYQKHIDFLIGNLLKRTTIRNTDRVPIKNNNKRQENNSLREDNYVEIDSSNDC